MSKTQNAAPQFYVNPQTTLICAMLGIRDITAEILKNRERGGAEENVSATEALLQKTRERIGESKNESKSMGDFCKIDHGQFREFYYVNG